MLVLWFNLECMEYQFILTEYQEGIAQIILNRPEKLNAINFQMVEEINHALTTLDGLQVKALFIAGNEKAFSAGGDLNEMKTLEQDEAERRSRFIHQTFQKIQQSQFPTVAFISGICMGGGLELALHCDFRICTSATRMALPELQFGLIPGAGGTVQLPKQFGKANSAYYLFTGAEIPPEIALNGGIIQKIINPAEFSESLRFFSSHFKELPLEAVKAVKEVLLQHMNRLPYETIYGLEAKHFAFLLAKYGRYGIDDKFKK